MNRLNRFQATITGSPGTAGNVVLAAALGGRRLPGASFDGKTFRMLYEMPAGGWELRDSVYTHSTTTLSRGTLIDSSNGGPGSPAAVALDSTTIATHVVSADEFDAFAVFVGIYANGAALEAAKPAASNAGRFALEGSSAPYLPKMSDGSTWALLIPSSVGDPYVAIATSGTAQTISMASAGVVDITLTANCTLTLSGAVSGAAFSARLVLRQDSVGSRLVTWPSGTKWTFGVAPSLSTAANSIDEVVLTTFDGGTTVFGDFVAKGRA